VIVNLRKSTGFSLIEVLIAMTIGLAVLAVLGTVFSRTSSGRSDLERVTRLVENSRFAAEIIGEDVRHAGFYGTLMPASDTVYDDASPCGWNTADVTLLGWRPGDTPPRYPAPLQGWNDPAAGVAELNCLPNRIPGTDVLVIRRVSSTPTPIAGVDANNVYVQASQCVSDPASVRASNDSAQFILRTSTCTAGTLAGIRRYMVRAYYVASCNDCTNGGDGIPTLKRIENINSGYQETALAEGVQNLQFEYAFDTNTNGVAGTVADGAPEEMSTTNTLAGPTVTSWANVVAVRMHVLMRSSEPGLTADETPTLFDLGPGHANVACAPRFRCRLLTSTFRLNNVAGRRET
jgi:type IV pilus assembly protein PilW